MTIVSALPQAIVNCGTGVPKATFVSQPPFILWLGQLLVLIQNTSQMDIQLISIVSNKDISTFGSVQMVSGELVLMHLECR